MTLVIRMLLYGSIEPRFTLHLLKNQVLICSHIGQLFNCTKISGRWEPILVILPDSHVVNSDMESLDL